MTELQSKFVELEKRKEEVKQYFKDLEAAAHAVADEIGIGKYFQDEESGIVYKIVKPKGRYVEYEEYGYARTRRDGEDKGTLSIKEARENGFTV